ncbi:hypothetical protein HDIA_0977 [Hartmannibacter diazotrophicus]|uniref:DUF2735 domain-containing protein n=1 Tax=Hartmannibacter diazotrophicus TaxID=1482074 RepID=A0A2C9D2Y3_9HYPH|nr:DUF2735 domain-containing protein [Hartmannibacter diazotrophicus]SON54518.1 hypothetical protein HDIA_0977 [Hartmannibacter diazotrophicus]
MAGSTYGGTAKILEFPLGGRAGLARHCEKAALPTAAQFANYCDAASGGSWYHEEAVREAEHDDEILGPRH